MSTVNLNNADAIYFGDRPVDRVYLGTRQVWPWTPELLFQNGEQGGAWDFTTSHGLFQDAAGTTPVENPGDPIGMTTDLSGNGLHLFQATTPARPTYTEDGALHDGVDDFLMAAHAEDWAFLHDGSGGHLAFSSSWLNQGGSSNIYTGTQSAGGTSVGVAIGRQSSALSRSSIRLANGSESTPPTNSGTGSLPADQVISQAMEYDHPMRRAWLNNTQWDNTDISVFTPSSGDPANPLRTSISPHSGAQVMRRIIAISRVLTDPERAIVNAWLMEGVE